MLIVDCHLDLAMNAIHWNRDLTQPLDLLRSREVGMQDKPDRGRGTVCFPDMRLGEVRLCVATQIGHSLSGKSPVQTWHSPEIAWAQTQAQIAWYHALCEQGELQQITTRESLDEFLKNVGISSLTSRGEPTTHDGDTSKSTRTPIGFVLSLEGADSLLTLDHLHRAFGYGLRLLGPAHYGPGRYAAGTDAEGGLEPRGRELLREMDSLKMGLDVTHLTDQGFWESLEQFSGPVWASHHNCRALIPGVRQLTDDQIRALIARDGVIGAACDAWMLYPNWKRGITTPQSSGVTIENLVDHIDHVCQLAGNARHSSVGSDLDGAFGYEQTPQGIERISDLQKLASALSQRGYAAEDIKQIMHGNAIGFLRRVLHSKRG
jgi:membrane dipeptidase